MGAIGESVDIGKWPTLEGGHGDAYICGGGFLGAGARFSAAEAHRFLGSAARSAEVALRVGSRADQDQAGALPPVDLAPQGDDPAKAR